MRKWTSWLSIVVLVCLVSACGTDEAHVGVPNAGSDTGADGTTDGGGGPDVSDSGPDATDTGGDTCTGDDCQPDQVCAADEDCDAPEICYADRSGDSVDLTCQDPNAGGGALGDTCSADADCASNLCVDGECSRPCERPADCSDDGSFQCQPTELDTGDGGSEEIDVCVRRPASECSSDADCTTPDRCIAVKDTNEIRFECGSPNAGGAEVGDSCSADADCAQNLCRGDVCSAPCGADGDCNAQDFSCSVERIDLGNGNTDNAQVCAAPRDCTSNDDCRIGEVCYVERSGGDVTMRCRAENSGGAGLGGICSDDVGCAANLCHDGRFRQVCTNPCADDSDCPEPGYECGTASIDDGAGGTADVSVCVAEDPSPCTSTSDCASGRSCAVVPDAAGTGLESVCVPTAGGKATGVDCTDDSDCASLVCLDDFCAAPCTANNQCGIEQLCRSNTISKDGLSGDFNVCETLPDERCDQTGTCSDGARVCSEIRTVANNEREAYCRFPDPNAPETLGGHCTTSTDCREQICLSGNSDECSVVCAQDSQCAPGQLCTTFSVGTSQIGFCITGCTDNDDCAGLDYTNTNGDSVEHLCMVNENTRDNDADQTCLRKNIVDPNDPDAGILGDDCSSGSGSQCQSGLCLRTVSFDGTSCTNDNDCSAGSTCESAPGGGMQCGESDFKCSTVCDDDGDCSGGVSGNELTACASDVTITFNSGNSDTVSMCAKPN